MREFLSKFFNANYSDDKMLTYLAMGLFLGATLILILYVLRIHNRRVCNKKPLQNKKVSAKGSVKAPEKASVKAKK